MSRAAALLLAAAAAGLLLLLQGSQAAAPGRPYARHSRHGSTPSQRAQQRAALQAHVQALLRRCPLPGFCLRSSSNATAADYLREPGAAALRQQQAVVAAFLQGKGFQVGLLGCASSRCRLARAHSSFMLFPLPAAAEAPGGAAQAA